MTSPFCNNIIIERITKRRIYDTNKFIQKLYDILSEEDCSVENKPYKKECDELHKCYEELEKFIKKDKKLYKAFFEYDMADGLYQGATNDYYFREGFLCGARLALEICGVEGKFNR